MKINQDTLIKSERLAFIPYCKKHVEKYHEWMKSPFLQEMTASEPLSLDEEYEMQRSWREDEDKCTFILLDLDVYTQTKDEIGSMVGDVNLFFNDHDNRNHAELEVMIAEESARGKGYGQEAVSAMMSYGKILLN
eukprot:Nk52_evm8s1810 gene=Nk52_evmTU8s1810